MPLASIFFDLATHMQSAEFLLQARHPAHPKAFTRQRKLPLSALVALMLSGMRKSLQAELDVFFAHLRQQAQLVRRVPAQAFAQARAKLSLSAIPGLNDWLIQRAEREGLVSRWRGLRLVAADASTMRFGLRASHVKRAAMPDQILFGLFLPGAELMLAASLHGLRECGERQMLVQHLQRLSSTDLLLLDRGYPARWLVSLLNHRQIPFCMRVEQSGSGGFACVREFLRSGLAEQIVTLSAPDRCDADDDDCPGEPQPVRLIRHVALNGAVRVLMTNLMDATRFAASAFGDLYHQRWRIEESFKRLKHRLSLEHVTGLSQQMIEQDVGAKILCDNLQALTAAAAHVGANLNANARINHVFVHTALKPLLPALLLGKSVAKLLQEVLSLIVRKTHTHKEGQSKPRKHRPKSHKFMTQKCC